MAIDEAELRRRFQALKECIDFLGDEQVREEKYRQGMDERYAKLCETMERVENAVHATEIELRNL